MSEPKILITQYSLDRIRYLRDHGASINSIARTKGWPTTLIKRICDGVDVPYFQRKPKRDSRKPKKEMCKWCHIRPIDYPKVPHNKAHFLWCRFCRYSIDVGVIAPEHSIGGMSSVGGSE